MIVFQLLCGFCSLLVDKQAERRNLSSLYHSTVVMGCTNNSCHWSGLGSRELRTFDQPSHPSADVHTCTCTQCTQKLSLHAVPSVRSASLQVCATILSLDRPAGHIQPSCRKNTHRTTNPQILSGRRTCVLRERISKPKGTLLTSWSQASFHAS